MDRTRRNLLIGGAFVGSLTLAGLLPATCVRRQPERRPGTAKNIRPKRPPGEPKPFLDEDIAPVLARLDDWYESHLPFDKYVFNRPAKDTEIDAFERVVGLKMPPSYRQLYRWHDGEEDDRWGHIYGLPLLSLHEAASQWKAWNHVLAGIGGDPYEIRGGAWPPGAVDPAYINPRWIPLTHDGSGNHIGLDFDPWPGGRRGQVILYGRDEDVKAVVAESLGTFLNWIAGLLESGNFRLGANADQRVLRQFRLKVPSSDDFHDGARILLGAPGAQL
jgi:cell wall assembly regulator SMI1